MAHFAQLDAENGVLAVNVVGNADAPTEEAGAAFCRSLWGQDSRWVQTSYNANFRKNFAGVGFVYDQSRDAFIPPQPGPDWTLDEESCRWLPPEP